MRRTALLMLAALLVGACANGPNSSYEEFGDRINTEGFGHQYAQPEGETSLVLGPGDTLRVDVANNPDLSTIQVIRYEGVIRAPYVGDVKVAGLTSDQIRDKLVILLSPFVRDVALEVTPLRIQSKNIYVFSTNRVGTLVGRRLPIRGDFTLIDFIASIGGTPLGIDDCNIKVMRADPRHPKPLVINVRDMVVNGFTAANIRLMPDDIIWMPPTFFLRVAQTLEQVTFPLQTIRRSLRDVEDLRNFIEEGELRDSRFRR